MPSSGKQRGSEHFFTDAEGKRRDEGLYDLVPADPTGFAMVSARAALRIGIPRDQVARIYGEAAVSAAELEHGTGV